VKARLTIGACAALALAIAGCGSSSSSSSSGGSVSGTNLTIYSSVPLQGSNRPNSVSVNQGAQLALAAMGGKIGKYTITFKPLDDSTAQAGKWDPGQTTSDAHTAVNDSTTIGYLGEFNSGASAISIPLVPDGAYTACAFVDADGSSRPTPGDLATQLSLVVSGDTKQTWSAADWVSL
jgi:hypothetical protein